MKIVVNKDAFTREVVKETLRVLEDIQINAEGGRSVTKVSVPEHLFFAVRKNINVTLQAGETNYVWLDLGGYVSYRAGANRVAKIKIKD